MNDPKAIQTIQVGATYEVPTYVVTNEGLQDGSGFKIQFCKGNKDDETVFRQEGFFTETMLETCAKYLRDVNVGELANREAAIAITKIEEALLWLGKRAEDRKRRGVQGTYQK